VSNFSFRQIICMSVQKTFIIFLTEENMTNDDDTDSEGRLGFFIINNS
jgi:hypothetical protein